MPSGGTHSRPAALGAVGRAPHNQRCKGHRQRAAAVRRGAPLTQTALLRSPLRPIPSPHRVSPPPPAPTPSRSLPRRHHPRRCPQWGPLLNTAPPPPPLHHHPLHDTAAPPFTHRDPTRPRSGRPPPALAGAELGRHFPMLGVSLRLTFLGNFNENTSEGSNKTGRWEKPLFALCFCLLSFFLSYFFFLFFFFSICAAPSDGLRQLRALLPFPTGVTSVPTRRHPAVSALSPRSPASRTVTLWGGAGGLSPTLTVSPRLRCPLPPPGAVSLRAAGHSGQRGHGSHHGSHRWAAAPGSALPLPSRSGFPSPSQEQS